MRRKNEIKSTQIAWPRTPKSGGSRCTDVALSSSNVMHAPSTAVAHSLSTASPESAKPSRSAASAQNCVPQSGAGRASEVLDLSEVLGASEEGA